jgi:hypothetical protein
MFRHVALAFGLAVAATGLLWWPADRWHGDGGVAALALSGALCALGALVGRVVTALIERASSDPAAGAIAVQAGIGTRLLVTLVLTFPVLLVKPVPMMPFTAFLAVHYVIQLVLEVFVSLRESGQNHGPSRSATTTSREVAGPERAAGGRAGSEDPTQ